MTCYRKCKYRYAPPEDKLEKTEEWTIQRHWQHWAHNTQDEDKENTRQNTES